MDPQGPTGTWEQAKGGKGVGVGNGRGKQWQNQAHRARYRDEWSSMVGDGCGIITGKQRTSMVE